MHAKNLKIRYFERGLSKNLKLNTKLDTRRAFRTLMMKLFCNIS